MSGINLALPVDIPWKLLTRSADMMDRTLGNNAFPPPWRSSIAIFHFEPPELPDELQDRRITYFKIACTITGYQADRIDRKWIDFGPLAPEVVNGFSQHVKRYYPCYGALLQVAVFPGDPAERADLANFPVVADFEPKRRDLYELVTETGEVLSGSSNRAAVSKGFTSTFNTERSWSLTGTGEVKGNGGSVGGSATVGGKQSSGTQDSTITQVDYAREKRESQSHATSLTQMYNLLQGYHLGTNRPVFLVLPRPHIAEQIEKRTFINGPREIEGVQEFFLVVSRPRHVEHVCIEAHLETGHLDLDPATSEPPTETPMLFEFLAPREIEHGGGLGNDSTSASFARSTAFAPPAGYEIDLDRGQGGYTVVDVEGSATYAVTASSDGVTVSGTVVTQYIDGFPNNRYVYQDIKGELTIYTRKKTSLGQEEARNTFFITARQVTGCTGGHTEVAALPPDWVVFESVDRIDPRLMSRRQPAGVRVQLANDLATRVGRRMIESQHPGSRYRPAAVDFHQSQFVLDRLAAAVRRRSSRTNPLRRRLADTLDRAAVARLEGVLGATEAVGAVVAAPLATIREATGGGTAEEALALKWKALGFGPRKLPS